MNNLNKKYELHRNRIELEISGDKCVPCVQIVGWSSGIRTHFEVWACVHNKTTDEVESSGYVECASAQDAWKLASFLARTLIEEV